MKLVAVSLLVAGCASGVALVDEPGPSCGIVDRGRQIVVQYPEGAKDACIRVLKQISALRGKGLPQDEFGREIQELLYSADVEAVIAASSKPGLLDWLRLQFPPNH